MTEDETTQKIVARVAKIMKQDLGGYIGEITPEKRERMRAQMADKVRELVEMSIERAPKVFPYDLPVIPIDGLPEDTVACVRKREDGSFDIECEHDIKQGDVHVNIGLELIKVRIVTREEGEDE